MKLFAVVVALSCLSAVYAHDTDDENGFTIKNAICSVINYFGDQIVEQEKKAENNMIKCGLYKLLSYLDYFKCGEFSSLIEDPCNEKPNQTGDGQDGRLVQGAEADNEYPINFADNAAGVKHRVNNKHKATQKNKSPNKKQAANKHKVSQKKKKGAQSKHKANNKHKADKKD